MELLEILTPNTPNLVNKQPIITSKIHSDLYMIYSKKINAWIWCDPNGKALEYEGDLIRVDLSKDILEDDTWYIYSDNNKSQKLKEIIKNKECKTTFFEEKMLQQGKEWEELVQKPIKEQIDKYVRLGIANLMGLVLYCLHQENMNKEDIKRILITNMNDDVDLRSNSFGVWGDIEGKMRKR